MKREYFIHADDIRSEGEGIGFTLKAQIPKGLKVSQICALFSELIDRFGIKPEDIILFRKVYRQEITCTDMQALRKALGKDGE